MTVIAVIAPGEMGSAIGARLADSGARVITSLAGRSRASAERAARARMEPAASDDELAQADFVLSIVPPGEAVALAQRLAPALARVATKPVYVDCNAVAPQTAQRIGAVLAGTGCRYVDAAIIGPPPAPSGTRTILYVAGEAAREVARLDQPALIVRVLDAPAGAASALKMSYAGITKGLTGLAAMMMLGATRAGCAEALSREMAESQPHLLAWVTRNVPRMYPKAYRWAAEMEEIAAFVDDAAGRDLYRAMARFYGRLAADAAAPTADGEIAQLTQFCVDLADAAAKKRA